MSKEPALRRAVSALRAGRAVQLEGKDRTAIVAVETANDELLAAIDPLGSAKLLISGARAAVLALTNAIDAADARRPVMISGSDWLDCEAALALADPGLDLDRAPIGPLTPVPVDDPDMAEAALALARMSGLLPALWVMDGIDVPAPAISADMVLQDRTVAADLIARAKLPLDGLPDSQILVFRSTASGEDDVALVVGAFGGKPPLVRLHSECLTGDVFGSLKCDCGPQLKEALRLIGIAGGGILLYLRQEGRGIGLANKVRAYALQDRGFDTVDSNRRLGFEDDERNYLHAAAILRSLGIDKVRLLTNNPGKVEGLELAGIDVVERVAHHMPANPHNADYLATKRSRSGHLE